MDERKRAEIRAKQRKAEVKNPRKVFKYFSRALTTVVTKSRVAGRFNLSGIKRVENIFVIGRYVRVRCRLILRNLFDHKNSTGVRFIEPGMLSPLARFWLCVARWKHLKTLKVGAGVKGANRSTRIKELAADLRVPVELVRMYIVDAEDNDYSPKVGRGTTIGGKHGWKWGRRNCF